MDQLTELDVASICLDQFLDTSYGWGHKPWFVQTESLVENARWFASYGMVISSKLNKEIFE